ALGGGRGRAFPGHRRHAGGAVGPRRATRAYGGRGGPRRRVRTAGPGRPARGGGAAVRRDPLRQRRRHRRRRPPDARSRPRDLRRRGPDAGGTALMTTTSTATDPTLGERWRRWRFPAVVLLGLLLTALILALIACQGRRRQLDSSGGDLMGAGA